MALSRDEVRNDVKATVADRLRIDKDTVLMGVSLTDDYGAESLDVVEIVMETEDVFDLTIPDADADRIKTSEDLVTVVLNGGRYPT